MPDLTIPIELTVDINMDLPYNTPMKALDANPDAVFRKITPISRGGAVLVGSQASVSSGTGDLATVLTPFEEKSIGQRTPMFLGELWVIHNHPKHTLHIHIQEGEEDTPVP